MNEQEMNEARLKARLLLLLAEGARSKAELLASGSPTSKHIDPVALLRQVAVEAEEGVAFTPAWADRMTRLLIRAGLSLSGFLDLYREEKPPTERQQRLMAKACDLYHRDGELEIDENAICSDGVDAGGYVLCWRWVDEDEPDEEPDEEGPARNAYRKVSVNPRGYVELECVEFHGPEEATSLRTVTRLHQRFWASAEEAARLRIVE